jgi:electron transfer flavoprotein beta subunit
MKIAVCIKQVLDRDAPLIIDADGERVRETDLPKAMGEADRSALELALSLKEATAGELVVISLGEASAMQVIRDALARGADRGVLLHHEGDALEPLRVAAALAEVLRGDPCDCMLTGVQSDDGGQAQTGVMLAELLGVAHTTMVVEAAADGPDSLRARRELEGGALQWWRVPTPCVVTVQAGAYRLRHANIKGVMAAKKKPVATVAVAEAMLAGLPETIAIVGLSPPPPREGAERIEGTTEEVIPRLATVLTEYRSA